jgi:hypothetical protein
MVIDLIEDNPMSVDPRYHDLHDQVHQLEFHIHDAIGNHEHPSAQLLRNEMRHLQDDLETHKNPRDLENRIKVIQHTLLEARNTPNSYMNVDHADHFYRTYEDMRRNVREFNDYS